MSPAKQYTISLEVRGPDGFHRYSTWEMEEHTGSLSIEKLVLLWTQLRSNLSVSLDMKSLKGVVSLLRNHLDERGF